jgi:hypothetical protein
MAGGNEGPDRRRPPGGPVGLSVAIRVGDNTVKIEEATDAKSGTRRNGDRYTGRFRLRTDAPHPERRSEGEDCSA